MNAHSRPHRLSDGYLGQTVHDVRWLLPLGALALVLYVIGVTVDTRATVPARPQLVVESVSGAVAVTR